MSHMSRFHFSPDGASRRLETGGLRKTSALRGFVDDIALLFAIMLGRDMVQRSQPVGPETGSGDAPFGPH